MKLTVLALMLSILGSWASQGYSQTTRLTLDARNLQIEEFLRKIEDQSEFRFFYSGKIDVQRTISKSFENQSINEVLDVALNGTDIKYEIKGRQIILSSVDLYSSEGQQYKSVSGKVTDNTGAGLPGVSVVIKGTTNGTITGGNGNYSLTNIQENAILQFSFVGMKGQEIAVAGKTTIDVVLAEDAIGIEEVVAVGYGTQKKATLTGSISEMKGQELKRTPQANLSNSFAGKFSGIIVNNRSGEPGYDDSKLYVRGLATTGNNDILVVVDGVPGQIGGISRLDPNDIESITVLKDASAAVYGSRAANGVILVTTKRGEAGKPTLNYSFNYGLSMPTRLPKMADAATYAEIMNEINYYNNPAGGNNQFYSAQEIEKFRNGSDPINYPNTDWAKVTLKNATPQIKHNVTLSGGAKDLKYFISVGALNQEGLYKNGATKYDQYNVRSNIDADINERLTVGVNLAARKENRTTPVSSASDVFRSIYRAYPTVSARYPNGLPSTGIENNNPIMMATNAGGTNDNDAHVLNTIFNASYKIPYIEGLTVDGVYAIDKSWAFNKAFSKPYPLFGYNKTTGKYAEVITGGSAGKAMLTEYQENYSLSTASIKLNYDARWGENQIKALAGYEQSENRHQRFEAIRYNFPTPETPELSQGGSAAADKNNSGRSYKYTRRSYFGRISYDFSERYMLEVQMRVDGSSIFPSGKRYGFFPAISGGWRISKERWFEENLRFVNSLKLRASYGELGNDNVDQFQYYNNYSFNNQYFIGSDVHPGIDLVKLANPNITWEVAKKTDIGIDARLWKNFSLELIYFQQNRSNILAARNASIPRVSGIVNGYDQTPLVPFENIGKVDNNGFESTIGYTHTGEFTFRASVNVTYAKNKVVFVDEAAGILDYQKATGKPLNSYLLYKAIGIYRTAADLLKYPHLSGAQLGDLIYEDYSGDGKITADDRVRTDLGNIPELSFGLNLSANWKNFDLSMAFAGQARVRQYVLAESGTVGNFYSSWADNRWSVNNTNGSYPRVDTRASASVNGGLYQNDFWLNDASFLRLKNLELGYTIPSSQLSKYKIGDVRIYASGFNLITLTKVKDYDPEGNSESGQFYPQQKIINMGINVKF